MPAIIFLHFNLPQIYIVIIKQIPSFVAIMPQIAPLNELTGDFNKTTLNGKSIVASNEKLS